MLEDLGRQRIESLQFRAIPRGGLIVLGHLAYALQLRPEQLSPRSDSPGQVCIVDDCSLSGHRFGGALAASPPGTVAVFVHLLSHPQLRRSISRAHPEVTCFAGEDLVVQGAQPDERGDGGDLWAGRNVPHAYWRGQTEALAFPWSEPDVAQWDPRTERVEQGWHLASPDHCAKNRYALGPPRGDLEPPRWQVPEDVAYGVFDGELLLYRNADGTLHQPSREGALIWRLLARYGTARPAVEALVDAYGVDPVVAEADVDRYASTLHGAGLLEPTSG